VNEVQNHMADAPEVMNIRQASRYLGVSADTLYKYVYEERIPAFKLGNRWKFKKTILDAWMERKSTQGEGRGRKKLKAQCRQKPRAHSGVPDYKYVPRLRQVCSAVPTRLSCKMQERPQLDGPFQAPVGPFRGNQL